MKKFALSVTVMCMMMLSNPATVFAHVLLSDESKQYGAVLHVNPDDDPVAGETASLVYIIDDKTVTTNNYSFDFTIEATDRKDFTPELVSAGSSQSVEFVFPTQGVYILKLTATSLKGNDTIYFISEQRVDRGVRGAFVPDESYGWAEALLIGCFGGGLLVMLSIRAHKKDILLHSRW